MNQLNKHYIVRLVTNEMIIGELQHETDDKLIFSDTQLIIERILPAGSKALILDTYDLFTNQNSTSLFKSAVVSMAEPSPEMKDYYVVSIAYNHKFSDSSFHENIKKATEFLWEKIEESPSENDESSSDLLDKLRLNLSAVSQSNSIN